MSIRVTSADIDAIERGEAARVAFWKMIDARIARIRKMGEEIDAKLRKEPKP